MKAVYKTGAIMGLLLAFLYNRYIFGIVQCMVTWTFVFDLKGYLLHTGGALRNTSSLSHDAFVGTIENATQYLEHLCYAFPSRCVGTQGNCEAVNYVKKHFQAQDLQVEETFFEAINWHASYAFLQCSDVTYEFQASPYSCGCDITAELAVCKTKKGLLRSPRVY